MQPPLWRWQLQPRTAKVKQACTTWLPPGCSASWPHSPVSLRSSFFLVFTAGVTW